MKKNKKNVNAVAAPANRWPLTWWFVLAGVMFLAYLPAFFAPFYFDDFPRIVDNPFVKSFFYLRFLWIDDPSRFLTNVTFAMNYAQGRLNPAGYHVFSLILHGCVGVAYYFFLKFVLLRTKFLERFTSEEKKQLMFWAVSLFLVHPLQASAATYVAQRSTLLASLFYIWTLNCYLRFRQDHKK